jgi:epoxyqueuosine reductase
VRAAELTAQLKRRAAAAGFDAVGIAPAGRLERDAAVLEAWLAKGRQAGLAWMGRDPERRADPSRLLPGCRSVVALAANYWAGEREQDPPSGHGRVARYAWGRDYHKVLGRKLEDLAAWLESATGLPARACVDTLPVLERGWARECGIGWIGKNANLLTRELGSWLLLGELLTGAELDPDPGFHEDPCGSCTACIEACPTGAIVEDGVVDCNLCISYWTIEHRGPIPAARRPGLGDWIFGCDRCQEVCPWNLRFARAAPAGRFQRRRELETLCAGEIAVMDEATFRGRYSGTSLMRARWDGLRRNACVVLGNLRRPDSVPALERGLGDTDPLVRSHAAWALGRIGGSEARRLLQEARGRETVEPVVAEIERALAECRPA